MQTGMRDTVLVVDDKEAPRRALAYELIDAGFDVLEAPDGVKGWESFHRNRPALVVTDLVMPRSDGLELLRRIREHSEAPVIMFTAYGTVESAVSALKGGADEFLTSEELDIAELVDMVRRALERSGQPLESPALEARLVGTSEGMRRLRSRVAALAPLSTPVLVTGEPGSGRSAVVSALHELGATSGHPLVQADARSMTGREPLPDRGAVHLIDAERLPAEAQAHWAERLGRNPLGRSAVRLLASSTKRFEARVATGHLDRRLGQMLLRFHIQVPPLRERAEDIPLLASGLVTKLSEELGRRRVRLSRSALEFLAEQHWPGNLEELERVLERAVAFSHGQVIRFETVSEILSEIEESVASIRDMSAAEEREALLAALRRTGGNVTQTAELLERSRPAVYRLMEKHGIPLLRRG